MKQLGGPPDNIWKDLWSNTEGEKQNTGGIGTEKNIKENFMNSENATFSSTES